MDAIVAMYQPEAGASGAELTWRIGGSYDNPASMGKLSERWWLRVSEYLLDSADISDDTFALIMCHEMGHIVGGFPFKIGRLVSAEEQSDYFAAKDCLRRVWGGDPANADAEEEVDAIAREACDDAWCSRGQRRLCYRTSVAALGMGAWLAARRREEGETIEDPSFATPDGTVSDVTLLNYSSVQCRVDTLLAGALCDVPNEGIPGAIDTPWGPGAYTREVEAAAEPFACAAGTPGARPSCWFRPEMPLHDCEGIPATGACLDEDHVVTCIPYRGPETYTCGFGCVYDEEYDEAYCG